MTSDSRSMDRHLQANAQLHYGVNGGTGRNARPGEDDALQFLSREEAECLKFFEKTIDSLEDGLEDNDRRQMQLKPPSSTGGYVSVVDGPPVLSPTVSTILARPPSPKDHDIIDLVRPDPDLLQSREPTFSPTNPDFSGMLQPPESHFEIKPRRESVESWPSEYNPPLPSGSYGSTSHSSYHPQGSVPTPVLIAQKIAENQAGGNTNISPSSLLRRCSLESEKPASYSTDPTVKHGPPTSTKPNRLPANISLTHGSKEHQSQSLPNVSINERRAQMLANLTGTAHPLLQEDTQNALEQKVRNTPSRSISFKDPSPDKSRLEALSKLGLNRNRAMSGGMSLLATPDSTSLHPLTDVVDSSDNPVSANVPQTTGSSNKRPETRVSTPHQSPIHVDRKPEIVRTDSAGSSERFPSPPPENNYYPPPLEIKAPSSPEINMTSPEFNRYGGKSIVINPNVSSRSEPTAVSPTSPEPKTLPTALAHPSEFNDYGGKTKVMNPVAMTRSNLPDILSSHIDKSRSLPAQVEPLPTELNSYGGKSRLINPSTGINRPSVSPARSFKAPVTAPKPPRHSYHGAFTPQKAAPRASSPDKRRSGSMFRPQSITVKFSGKGATDESRRDALRKLGLLKDS